MSLIVIEHLRKEYPDAIPLRDVNAVVEQGDVIAVIGASGCGKSTLLRCINGLEQASAGRITVSGEEVTDPDCNLSRIRQKAGMVFQSFNLFQNMNIIDNVTAGPVYLLKKPREEARREGMELLRRVGLAEKAESFPEELSGGQKQRAAIARAIAMKPDILLFDEPTSALDPAMVGEVQRVIRNLAEEGMTMLIVTHEMKFAREAATRVFYMDEGIIYEEGSPEEIFAHPKKEKTRQFIRQLRTLSVKIESADHDFPGMFASIEAFGEKQLLPRQRTRNIILAAEELILQTILPEQGEASLPIQVLVEHAEADDTTELRISFGGKSFDPFGDPESLSGRIVTSLAEKKAWEYNERNTISLRFRQ